VPLPRPLYIAPTGLSGGREVRLHYLFDHAATALDERFTQVDPALVRRDIDALLNGSPS
jgi:hypothetical protein